MSRTETASYKRCRSRSRSFSLKRSIRSLKGSAGLKLKSPCLSPIGYDRKKKSLVSRTGMMTNSQSSESRSKSPKSEPAAKLCLPNYLEDVAEKVLEASEIMQTQIYQRLAQYHLSIRNPEQVHNGELPADTSKIVDGRQELGDEQFYPTRGRTLSRKVKGRTILSQSQAVFFTTLAKNIQNTVRNVEGLLQEAYLDLRFIRQVITGPELDTSEKLEEELEILLDKINQFSISDPSRSRRRVTLRGHFQLSLDNIAEEKEEN